MKRSNLVKPIQGFTLLELVVAMFLAIVVLASIFSLLYRGQNAFSREIEVAHSNQALRSGMEMINRDLANAGYKVPSSIAVLVNDGGGSAPDQLTTIYAEGEGASQSKPLPCGDDAEVNPCLSLDELSSIKLYAGGSNLSLSQLEQAHQQGTVLLAVEEPDCNEDAQTGIFPFQISQVPTVDPQDDSIAISYRAANVDDLSLPPGYNTQVDPDCAEIGLYRVVQYRIQDEPDLKAALERRDFSQSEPWTPVSDQVDDLQVQFADMKPSNELIGKGGNDGDSNAVQVTLGFGGAPLSWGGSSTSKSGGGAATATQSSGESSQPSSSASSDGSGSSSSSGKGGNATSPPSGSTGGDVPSEGSTGESAPAAGAVIANTADQPAPDGGQSLSTTVALRNLKNESAAGIPIAKCGQTLDLPGGRYHLARDLSSASGTCLTITASGVELDGQGHSIHFGGVGILMAGAMKGNRIHDVVFRSQKYGGGKYYVALMQLTGGWSNVSVDNNEFHLNNVSAVDLYGILYGSGVEGSGNHISNNLFIGSGTFRVAFSHIAWGTGSGEIHDNVARMGGTSCQGRPHVFANTEGRSVKIYDNEITVGTPEKIGYPCETQVLSFYKGQGHQYYGNTVTDFGGHSRLFHFDYTDDVRIHDNTAFQNGSSNDGASYGIVLRFDVDGAVVYGNTIDGAKCSGECFQVMITSGALADGPRNVRFHDNEIIGKSELLRFFTRSGPAVRVYNNSLELLSGSNKAQFIHFFGWNKKLTGVHFAYNNITNKSGHETVIRFSDGPGRDAYPAGPVSFCSDTIDGRQLSDSDVADVADNDWWITRTTCDFGTPQ